MSSCDLKTCISPDILELSQKSWENNENVTHIPVPIGSSPAVTSARRLTVNVRRENENWSYRRPKFKNDPNHAWKRSRSAIVSKKGKKN